MIILKFCFRKQFFLRPFCMSIVPVFCLPSYSRSHFQFQRVFAVASFHCCLIFTMYALTHTQTFTLTLCLRFTVSYSFMTRCFEANWRHGIYCMNDGGCCSPMDYYERKIQRNQLKILHIFISGSQSVYYYYKHRQTKQQISIAIKSMSGTRSSVFHFSTRILQNELIRFISILMHSRPTTMISF